MITPGANFEALEIAAARRAFVPSTAMADPAQRAEFLALTRQYSIEFVPSAQ